MGAAATTDLLYTGLYLCGNIPDFSHIVFTSRWWCTEDNKRKFVISILLVSCDWYNAKCTQFFMPITSVGLSNHFASLMLVLLEPVCTNEAPQHSSPHYQQIIRRCGGGLISLSCSVCRHIKINVSKPSKCLCVHRRHRENLRPAYRNQTRQMHPLL
jgi:hypothetical protein